MGIFAQHAVTYADAGLPVFPVDTQRKRPGVKGWQGATARRSRGWASCARLGKCHGIGLVMGPPSRLVEVDVDAVGDAWLSVAMDRFGETSVVIRTASGKGKLWYRANGEGRRIRPIKGLPIDILGDGFTIAPPSWREDLGEAYLFLSGSLADLDSLPCIRPGALEEVDGLLPEVVQVGRRNDSLWRYCMAQARHADDVAALIDLAITWASALPEPLDRAEAERCARSAWRYQEMGVNILGQRKPQLTEGDILMDELIDAPDAFTLLLMFQSWHGNRPQFAIAPQAMSEAGSPPWPRRRIERARDVLMERGFLDEVAPPDQRNRRSGLYRLRR